MRKLLFTLLLAATCLATGPAAADTVDDYLLGKWNVSQYWPAPGQFTGTLDVQQRTGPTGYSGMIALSRTSGERLISPVTITTNITNVFVTVTTPNAAWPEEMAVTMGVSGSISIEARSRMSGYAIYASGRQVGVEINR